MEQELFKLATGNSLWAALFVLLFLYTIFDSRNREKNYQNIITELSDKFGVMEDVQKDVSYIKDKLERR